MLIAWLGCGGQLDCQSILTHRGSSQVWNTSSGLPQDTVRQLLQTRDGFLWMATEGGLVRFDGYDFAVYDKRSTPAFASDLVNGLLEDAAGNLWIATSDGLLERSGESFRCFHTQDGLASNSVWAVGQDHLGRIWAATSAGVSVLASGKFRLNAEAGVFDGRLHMPMVSAADGSLWMVSSSAVTRVDRFGKLTVAAVAAPAVDIAAGSDGGLWVATGHGLLRVASDGLATSLLLPTLPGDGRILSVASGPDDTLWVGTTAGLYACQRGVWRKLETGASGNRIEKLFVERDGSLAMVTGAGVSHWTQGEWTPVFQQEGFQGRDVLSVYQDRDADIWLGSEGAGAAVLRYPPITTLGSRDGLPADLVRSVQTGNDGTLWLGTSAGLAHLEGGHFRTQTTAQGLASDEILALTPGVVAGSVWVGTPDGLSYVEGGGGRAVTLTASDGLPDDNIRSLLLANDHTLWIGTSHGLASLPRGDPAQVQSLHMYTQTEGLGSNVIGALLEDADGSLWVGTLNGLSHLTGGGIRTSIRTYGQRDGLTAGIVTALGRDSSGVLWIGTGGGGLFALVGGMSGGGMSGGKISRVGSDADVAAGRLPGTVYGILEDDSGHLWLSSASGIYRVAARDLLSAIGGKSAGGISIAHYDVPDGLRLHDLASGGHPEAALTRDGLLWFATLKGSSVVDSHNKALDPSAPPVALESISVDDALLGPQTGGGGFRVAAGHERLAFHYAGLSLATPSKVRYRYQLEHFDHGWIDAGTRRTAYYTNVPPGRYTFRVLASLNGGEWSATAASIAFTIEPHYYQTWWFYTLVAVLTAVVAWQLYLYRLRQVELRFDAVLAERGRIAREIHDTLAQDIVGISVQLELVSRLMTLSIDKARDQLTETRGLVRRSLAGARSSIWDLRSPASGASDLPSRVRDMAKQLTGASGVALALQIGGTYRAFPSTMEDELLRIAQEAITNALRHATPKSVRVSLQYHAAGARLEVQDDGRGFVVSEEKSGPEGHYGIRGMHERAERAQATLEIRSTPGSGTTVIAEAISA